MSVLAAGGFEPTDVMMEKPNTSHFTKYTHSLAVSQLTELWDVLTRPLCTEGAGLPCCLSSVTTAESPKADEITGNPHCSEVPNTAWRVLQPQCVGGSAAVPKKVMKCYSEPALGLKWVWGEEGDELTRKEIAIVV